jgi:hypothetical protein
MLLLALGAVAAVSEGPNSWGAGAPACDLTKSGQEFCDDFCNYRCGFYNESAGENGQPKNITIYRITPSNVTGVLNKNTADGPGDITFVISKKNQTQYCLHDPQGMGCATDIESNDLYGAFKVEVDGQFGPYQMCNPATDEHGRTDTSNWFCGLECIHPSASGCPPPSSYNPPRNGTSFEGVTCYCDRTKHAIGRGNPPNHNYVTLPGYPPQCEGVFTPSREGSCIGPYTASTKAYKTLQAWSFESAASMACQECYADKQCAGWRSLDNRTVELFSGYVRGTNTPGCVGGAKYHSSHGGGSNWYGLANLGGCKKGEGCANVWYSTTDGGQCAPGKPLGTDGCSWRLVETIKYANATCVDNFADAAIEAHGKACFDKCPQPLNKNTDCYLNCYRNTLTGDAAQNLSAVDPASIIAPWKKAFATDDPAKGGCKPVKPTVGPLPTPPPTPAPPTPPPTPFVQHYKCIDVFGHKACLPNKASTSTHDDCVASCK